MGEGAEREPQERLVARDRAPSGDRPPRRLVGLVAGAATL